MSDVRSQPVNSLMPNDIHFDAGTVNPLAPRVPYTHGSSQPVDPLVSQEALMGAQPVNPQFMSGDGHPVFQMVNPLVPGVQHMSATPSVNPLPLGTNLGAAHVNLPSVNPLPLGTNLGGAPVNLLSVNPLPLGTNLGGAPVNLPSVNSLPLGTNLGGAPVNLPSVNPLPLGANLGAAPVNLPSVNHLPLGTNLGTAPVNLPSVNPLPLGTNQGGAPVNLPSVNPLPLGTNLGAAPVNLPSVNPFSPGPQNFPVSTQYSACSDLSKFLIKKDLLLARLINFDERPETYSSWKIGFQNVMSKLSATSSEQLDLLIKYLGKESTKWAMTLMASNIHMPEHALSLIWERLDERFGSPEFLESALKFKLAKFPKILQN